MPKESSINDLLISYSGPGTPGDNGKSFAYTKILREYLRNMSGKARVMVNEAHEHILSQINRALDHGGLAFPPLRHTFSKIDNNIPLITFDATEPSADILSGNGDYKWGPLGEAHVCSSQYFWSGFANALLGRLPPGWEKNIDNTDRYWRPYFTDHNKNKKHWTRPWSSATRANENELWDACRFAEIGSSHVISRINSSPLAKVDQDTATGEWVTASDEFAVFMRDRLRGREEEARRKVIHQKGEATKREEVHLAEAARQQEAGRLQEGDRKMEIHQQQEALQKLETLRLQETALRQQKTSLQHSIYSQKIDVQPQSIPFIQKVVTRPNRLPREQAVTLAPVPEQPIQQKPVTQQKDEGAAQKPVSDGWQAWLARH